MPCTTSAAHRVLSFVLPLVFGVFLSHYSWADDSTANAGYLKNADLKAGWASWHGSGEIAFLKADGTEGAEGDPDVTPVIKVVLSHGQSREVSQEYEVRDQPSHLTLKVQVFASSDFKRSVNKNDYTPVGPLHESAWRGNFYWPDVVIPNSDFWIRGKSSGEYNFMYTPQDLQPRAWTTVKSQNWQLLSPLTTGIVNFCVPPGTGTVYLKNPSVKPK